MASASPSASPSVSPSASPSASPSVSPSASPSYGAPIMTEGNQCYFMQIAGWDAVAGEYKSYLYIANGVDSLVRYNGTTLETYTEIDAPANLTASFSAGGDIASGVHTYYGEVTALNAIGETVGSTEASITCCETRDNWTAGTDKVYWSWDTVSGASRYQLYIGDQSTYEAYLTDTDQLFFEDDGSKAINEYVVVPIANTTGAPKFKSMTMSNDRMWATNNVDDTYAVYWSGTGKDRSSFSEFYGGGVIYLERGGRELPVAVQHYQTGTGSGIATVLCKTPDGHGAVWQISIEPLTIFAGTADEDILAIPSGTKVVGSWGTESLTGVVATSNDIAFPNRKGWFSLGPEKNYYGILRTRELSSNIRPYWRSLIGSKVEDICAYFYDSKIFISVPTSVSGNDRMVIYDTERGNWATDWTIGAKQYLEYTDTSGVTHFLYIPLLGDRMIELSENVLNDLGTAFNQSYVSPLIPVSKTKTDLMKLKEAIVELSKPRGSINFQLLGIGKDNTFTTLASTTISDFGSNTGIGTDLWTDTHFSATQTNSSGGAGSWAIYLIDSPSTFAQATTKRALKKRAKVYALQFKVSSTTADTEYSILALQAKGRLITARLPSEWTS